MTEEMTIKLNNFSEQVETKRVEMGHPPNDYEIRIDAENGRVLYSSLLWPSKLYFCTR